MTETPPKSLQALPEANTLDWFFHGRDVLSTKRGIFLRPVGKAEDNPFSAPDDDAAQEDIDD